MRLTEDIFYNIGEQLNSRDALAHLCRVSKLFNAIFTPFLYRKIHVQHCSAQVLANISKLPSETHLRYCNELYVGKNIDVDDDDAKIYAIGIPAPFENYYGDGFIEMYNVESDVLKKCIHKMPALDILSVKDLNTEYNELVPDPNSILLSLSSSGKLQELSLHSPSSWSDWPLPTFHNLRKLSLRGIRVTCIPRIVDTLITSPNLQHLDLAGPSSNAPHETQLMSLITTYDTQRIASNASLLELKKLELGVGFLPQKSWNGDITDLSKLTEMTALKSLSVWNYTGRDVYPDVFECSGEYVPALYGFINLVHLKVNMVTETIIDLVEHLKAENPGALRELEVEEAHWAEAGREDGCVFQTMGSRDGKKFREFPVSETGRHWKKLCIGGIFGKKDTGNSTMIMQCENLEYLACDLPGGDFERFRIDVLPQIRMLKSLMVRNGPFEDRFATIGKSNPEEGGHGNSRDEVVNAADYKTSLAETVFQMSWDAWEARGREGEKLKYVGLGCEIYRFMLPSPRGRGQEGKWRAMKLTLDESREFEVVKSMLERDDDRFRL